MFNITVPVFDLGRSFRNVWSRECLEKVLKKFGNLFSKLCRNPVLMIYCLIKFLNLIV